MNYTNYKGKIVERFGVALNGWPCKCLVSNPNKVGGHIELSKLLHALQAKCCKWSKLSEEELQEHKSVNMDCHKSGEIIYKPHHKVGSARNKAHTLAFASAETIELDAGDNDDIDSSMEHDIDSSVEHDIRMAAT